MEIEHQPSAIPSVVHTEALPVAADALTGKQERFAQAVAAGSTATEAYRLAFDCSPGISVKTVHSRSYDLMRRPDVAGRIHTLRAAIADRFVSEVANLRMRQYDIATSEPLSEVKVFNCRKCWGINHRFQWLNPDELYDAAEEWAATKDFKPQREPSAAGGFGFDPFAPPSPDCPYCLGVGKPTVYLADTTKLTPAQRASFKSASVDKYGIVTVEQHDQQDAARELNKMIPGALAPARSESKTLAIHVEPLKDLSPEQIVELMAQQRLIT